MIDYIITVAKKAGQELMKYYEKPNISYKKGYDGRKSTVTQADHVSEKIITDAIRKKFPDHGIYGEEGTREHEEKEYIWHIDPLDGTTNFSRKIPLFGLSVGLTRNGFPILGVLYFPMLDLLVYAEKGKGAYANKKKIKVTPRLVEDSLYYICTAEARGTVHFPTLADYAGWIRAIDDSSFEFAQIAMGDADIYTFIHIKSYDVVAGAIIVQEAGGKVTDEYGKPWSTSSNIIVASNGFDHTNILKMINKDLRKKLEYTS